MEWPLYLLTRAWLALLGALPLPLARRLSMAFGRLALLLVPRLNRVASENINVALGDTVTPEQKRRILLDAMDNMAIVAAEFPHGPRLATSRFEGIIEVRGAEYVDRSRGALFISGHLANWEWMGTAWWLSGVEGVEVARPLDFPPLEEFVNRTRNAAGIRTLSKNDAGHQIFQLLREGIHVGILIDQAPRDNAVPTTFFGRECWSTIAPAMVAARAKVDIHFIGARRSENGSYVLEISQKLPLVKNGRLLDDLVKNTQLCQDVLEEYIRQNPGQWLWFHRRWKQRPRLAEEWETRRKRDKGGTSHQNGI